MGGIFRNPEQEFTMEIVTAFCSCGSSLTVYAEIKALLIRAREENIAASTLYVMQLAKIFHMHDVTNLTGQESS